MSFAEPVSCIFASKDKTLGLVVKGSNIIYRYIGNNKYVRIEDSIGIADSVEVKDVSENADSTVAVSANHEIIHKHHTDRISADSVKQAANLKRMKAVEHE